MRLAVKTTIDAEACTGCGLCVRVCPTECLSMVDGVAAVTGDESMLCGQCIAACPVDAVRVEGVSPVVMESELPPAAASLVHLMQSRRSCRDYKDRPVDRAVLADLVRAGTLAPSGTNTQAWAYTVLPDRAAVERLADGMGGFFRRIDRLASNPLLRMVNKPLRQYWASYHESVVDALERWEHHGEDLLFHGATAGIVVSMHRGASTPCEDANLAAMNVMLLAESLGLGTCMIGFAVQAMQNDRSLCELVGIPANERVYAVIAVGHPALRYSRPSGRWPVEPRWR